MIRTIVSIFLALGLLIGVSLYETHYVQTTFEEFHLILEQVKRKIVANEANYDDGLALRDCWEDRKKHLHVWITHTSLQEFDYQLDEAIGYLFIEKYEEALPKIEILLGLSENVPRGYSFTIGNVF